MKFKKIISLILSCVLVMNLSVPGFAFTEKDDVDLTVKVNNLEKQLIISEAEKTVLKSKIKSAELNNQKIFEKNIKELENQNKKLKKAITANTLSSNVSWFSSLFKVFDEIVKIGVLITGGSLYLAAKFEKPIKKNWAFKKPKDPCPKYLIFFRNYGAKVYDVICSCILKTLKNEEIQKQLEEIFKKSIPNCTSKKR